MRLPEATKLAPRAPQKPFHDRISGRIAIGLLCSSTVFIAFNFGGVKEVLRYVFSAGNIVLGDPLILKKAEDKADALAKKLEEIAKEHKGASPPVTLPTVPELNPVKAAGNAINNKVDEVKDDIKGAIGALNPAAQKAAEMFREKQERDRAARDAQTRVDAEELGIEFDETTPIEELTAKVRAE